MSSGTAGKLMFSLVWRRRGSQFFGLGHLLILLLGVIGTTAWGELNHSKPFFEVHEKSITPALRVIATQSGNQLFFSAADTEVDKSVAISGQYSVAQVLDLLLHDTGLFFEITTRGVIVIKKLPLEEAHEEVEMNKNKHWISGVLTSLIGVGGVQGIALAQDGTALGPSARVLEEVVVTARRRAENMQDVPIAITALSGDYLEQHKIDNFSDMQYHTPALTVSSAGPTTHNTVISLRGQRPVESNIDFEAAVPMYFSDVVLTPSFGTNLALYDLENVQVLKGPQGTLFGRNSTGGAVLFSPPARAMPLVAMERLRWVIMIYERRKRRSIFLLTTGSGSGWQ